VNVVAADAVIGAIIKDAAANTAFKVVFIITLQTIERFFLRSAHTV
jgi:hypothetical protein